MRGNIAASGSLPLEPSSRCLDVSKPVGDIDRSLRLNGVVAAAAVDLGLGLAFRESTRVFIVVVAPLQRE